jgi:DNA replication and repair protein RecF
VRSALNHLSLHEFRSYVQAELALKGRSAFLFGPNGAGKTNLLEAISLFSPGRGLRGASFAEIGRKDGADAPAQAWSISARAAAGDLELTIGSGSELGQPGRRLVRIDGEATAPGAMAKWIRPIWITPAQDRLFLDGAADRRRFFDRLVFAGEPGHARAVGAYDRALRERIRLLIEGEADGAWLSALEARMAKSGAEAARTRAATLKVLQKEIDGREGTPFPKAVLALTGAWERLAGEGAGAEAIETRLAAALAGSRARDAAAGRTLEGPHRGDLEVRHALRRTPAGECSTGEQKALILNLALAQAARLSRAKSEPNPILLLDEVAAHLDPLRRAALFDEIDALSLQAFLTGTEEALFESLRGRWMGVNVVASQLTVTEDST